MRLLAAVALLLSSCATPQVIPGEVLPYYREFEAEAGAIGTPVEFVDSMPENYVGYCNKGDVSLLRSYWERLPDDTRRTLVFHELGHCALGLKHSPDPTSFMQPFLLSVPRDELLRQLRAYL